jgi:HME family heavy-metal exporter
VFNKLVHLHNRLLVMRGSLVLMLYGFMKSAIDVFPNHPEQTHRHALQAEAGGMAGRGRAVHHRATGGVSGIPGVESTRSVSSAGSSFVYVGDVPPDIAPGSWWASD